MGEIKRAVTGHRRPGMSNVTLKVVATGGVGLSGQAISDIVWSGDCLCPSLRLLELAIVWPVHAAPWVHT